ncbi:hypothetical protein CMU02_06795 [Elizabethkingia anophelis]|uniref:Uncharacterized protein n=5 Tax=Bacteroidota TaxID=976 RepID=A0A1W1YIT1_9FLAO|nr:hypothetical protein KO02_14840 [Sphingobacterium sp. ML3W]KFF20077.1 hypothetical protein IW22_14255 [Chryseobacterium sp. JM1]MDV3904528.1 hypothetical protein [Elizabethkingia anophelis]SJN52548.1 hypothetical protein FM120_36285 [Sphingobacterium faecium PCAi_F2.5]SMC36140.1 hypothetical protein SAMN06296427_101439 [Moheibacter sediminis]
MISCFVCFEKLGAFNKILFFKFTYNNSLNKKTMSLCKLCLEREANKKNTHYLTDAIIRTCLNIEGSNEREKGLYFALDNTNPFIDFNFQRLDELTLETTIGRKPTEEEIENAKSIPFSVDYVFCSDCENLFTDIETPFIQNILPHFRQADLSGLKIVSEADVVTIRNFFHIQLYRSAVCEDILAFSPEFKEKLRHSILQKNGDTSIPLSVTHLQTLGGNAIYTENYIGFTDDKNPFIVFMNDFVIQVYENEDAIKFLPFHGLNEQETFVSAININEESFAFKIFDNAERKVFLNTVIVNEKVKKTIQYYRDMFDMFWRKLFGVDAPVLQKERYIQSLINGDDNNLIKYSKQQVFEFTVAYMAKLFNVTK